MQQTSQRIPLPWLVLLHLQIIQPHDVASGYGLRCIDNRRRPVAIVNLCLGNLKDAQSLAGCAVGLAGELAELLIAAVQCACQAAITCGSLDGIPQRLATDECGSIAICNSRRLVPS
jgi:hypothetical protein